MGKKSRETPEEHAYNLLTELREQNRIAHERLAEMKEISKRVEAQKGEINKMIFAIRKDLDGIIQEHVGKEVEAYAAAVQRSTEEACTQVRNRITQLASAMMGIPEGVLKSNESPQVTMSPLLGMPVITQRNKP
jgi:uncharacterized protein YukE